MLTAIVGVNWGDEGKGRMVDLISEDYDVVVRYQGGNNAGHTVINAKGKFILNLLPSGILRPEVTNVMGNGMVIDLAHLHKELESLRASGIEVTPDQLKISDRAMICLPYHVQQDILEEERLGQAKYGSTRRGIAPVYGDKYLKKGIPMYYLRHPEKLKARLEELVSWKSLSFEGIYGQAPLEAAPYLEWLETYGRPLLPFLCDVGSYLDKEIKAKRRILFEAQLGALRDIDFGIYPYTSSSSTIAAYAPIGAGIPQHKLDQTIGVMKAYSTCVGEGPFTCEWFGEKAEALREAGGEYGAATGRPRRVGPFDCVASRYGVKMQGADLLALTKLDVLSDWGELPVCVAYEINGTITEDFPVGPELAQAKPIFETLPGWKGDLSQCRTQDDLPKEALDYIWFLEKKVGCRIEYVSVGAQREEYIIME